MENRLNTGVSYFTLNAIHREITCGNVMSLLERSSGDFSDYYQLIPSAERKGMRPGQLRRWNPRADGLRDSPCLSLPGPVQTVNTVTIVI